MIVAVGSHPDDIELGCGATLDKLSSVGHRIAAVVVTNGEQARVADRGMTDLESIADRRREEAVDGLTYLGVDDITFLELPDLGVSVPELREKFPKFDEPIDCVVTHSPDDSHPDHRATANAVRKRFDDSKILQMESPSTADSFEPTVFVDVAEHQQRKLRALEFHETQRHKPYMKPEVVSEKLDESATAVAPDVVERFDTVVEDCKPLDGLRPGTVESVRR